MWANAAIVAVAPGVLLRRCHTSCCARSERGASSFVWELLVSQPRPVRRFSLIGVMTRERHAIHTGSYPLVPDEMLPLADVVVLVADEDPGAMLFRYTAYGEFGGDTWHPSVDDAQEQAIYEYGDALLEWLDVPAHVPDVHAYAVRFAAEHLKDRGN